MDEFVETHLGNFCVMLRSRALWVLFGLLQGTESVYEEDKICAATTKLARGYQAVNSNRAIRTGYWWEPLPQERPQVTSCAERVRKTVLITLVYAVTGTPICETPPCNV